RTRSLEQVVAESTARSRFNTTLMSAFAVAALLLAAVGVYGIMAYVVGERTREIGIRMALGADAGRVRSMVLRQGLGIVTAGIAAGSAASFWVVRVIAGLLFGVPPRDPVVFTTVPLVLAAVAMVAVWIPARRATHVDPVAAIRRE